MAIDRARPAIDLKLPKELGIAEPGAAAEVPKPPTPDQRKRRGSP